MQQRLFLILATFFLLGAPAMAQNCSGPVCGDGASTMFTAGEQCDDGNNIDGDGCSSTCQLEPGFDCTIAEAGVFEQSILPNGGFDDPDNPMFGWAEIDHSLFGSLVCGSTCLNAISGSDGCGYFNDSAYVILAGATFETATTGVAELEPFVIPQEATHLGFDWAILASGEPGEPCTGPEDGIVVKIDGVEVWSNRDEFGTCFNTSGNPYESVRVDLVELGLNDGESHVIRFEGSASAIGPNVSLTSVFLDSVYISVPADSIVANTPSLCAPGPDPDEDGLTDSRDNCPLHFNPEQEDSDLDGAGDACDNCLGLSNASQVDADGDGYGNFCDTDVNNDCVVNIIDLAIFRGGFFFSGDPVLDFNSDGAINVIDLGLFRSSYFSGPGPSALTQQCD